MFSVPMSWLAAVEPIGVLVRGERGGGKHIIMLLILLGLVGLLTALAVRSFRSRHRGDAVDSQAISSPSGLIPHQSAGGAGLPTAVQTLQHRFASGEIEANEYKERLAVLQGSDSAAATRPTVNEEPHSDPTETEVADSTSDPTNPPTEPS